MFVNILATAARNAFSMNVQQMQARGMATKLKSHSGAKKRFVFFCFYYLPCFLKSKKKIKSNGVIKTIE